MGEGLRHFITDIGYSEGIDFCRALLSTGEFAADVLRKFGGTGDKATASSTVADRLVAGQVSAEQLFLAFCQTPRQWLYVAFPQREFADPGPTGKLLDFFTRFGPSSAWHGPVHDDQNRAWMVFAKAVKNVVATGDVNGETTYRGVPVRWHVVLEIGETYVAAHWNNFSRHPDEDSAEHAAEQFEYWRYVPDIIAALAKKIGVGAVDVVPPQLHTLVLDTLIETYSTDPTAHWQHLRIRAESEGISLSARSGASQVREIDIKGIRALTHALAESATTALGTRNKANTEKVELALLRTLIREWGTLSYEFSLEPENDVAKHFRAHVYFGAKPDSKGPDQLPHCKCFRSCGGSSSALKFLLAHLEE